MMARPMSRYAAHQGSHSTEARQHTGPVLPTVAIAGRSGWKELGDLAFGLVVMGGVVWLFLAYLGIV